MSKPAWKRKNIIILLCCITVVIVLSSLAMLFKDVIRNGIKYDIWSRFSPFEELLNECEYTKNKDSLVLSCESLIEEINIDDKTNNVCYKVFSIGKREKNLRNYTFCENPEKIFFTNPYHISINNTLLPVKILFDYKIDKFNYALDKIEITTLSDKELYGEWFKDTNFARNIKSTGKLLLSDLVYYLMSLSGNSYIFPNTEIGGIKLYNVKLEEVLTYNDCSTLKFSGSFEGGIKPFHLSFNTRGFVYSDSMSPEVKEQYIQDKLIQETLIPKAYYEITLSYFTEKFVKDNKLKELCEINDELLLKRKSLCDDLDIRQQDILKYNIENIQDFITSVENPTTNWEGMIISDIVKVRDVEK